MCMDNYIYHNLDLAGTLNDIPNISETEWFKLNSKHNRMKNKRKKERMRNIWKLSLADRETFSNSFFKKMEEETKQ